MAYKNLLGLSGLTSAEVFRHVKDWLVSRNGIADYSSTGLGWTLHDSSFATDADTVATGDWVVITSGGENGKQGLVLQITLGTVAQGILQMQSGLSFNASTNSFVSAWPGFVVSNGMTAGSTFSLSIYGDLDSFTVLIHNGTTQYGQYFGLAEGTMHDQTIATTSGAESAGTDVLVGVDTVPASWSVGDKVVIRDEAVAEVTTISAISGTDVTMTLANSYSSGARIARDWVVLLGSGTNFYNAVYTSRRRTTAVASNNTATGIYNSAGTLTGPDPDEMNSCHLSEYIHFIRTSVTGEMGYYGRYRNVLVIGPTGITSGNVYEDDDTGDTWRAVQIGTPIFLFKEV